MSMPSFPNIDPPIQREDAVNQILSSIAMEELGLSHILNAEGEKLQYILGTIPGLSGSPATVSDVLAANESVRGMLETAVQNQLFLKSKMQGALTASPMQGPLALPALLGLLALPAALPEPPVQQALPAQQVLLARQVPPGLPVRRVLLVLPEPPVLLGRLFMHNKNSCLVMGH